MTTCKHAAIIAGVWILAVLLIVSPTSALPTTGAALTPVESNNVTIPVTGITGTSAWVQWGYNSGGYMWITSNYTPNGVGAVNVRIWGAPLMGSTNYYAVACDRSGCGNEITFTTGAITPLPTTTFGYGYKNMTDSHFNLVFVPIAIEQVYTGVDGERFPRLILYGIIVAFLFIGSWLRTKSIRLPSALLMLVGSLIFVGSSGLYLGVPLQEQLLGELLFSAGLAGWILSTFIKK